MVAINLEKHCLVSLYKRLQDIKISGFKKEHVMRRSTQKPMQKYLKLAKSCWGRKITTGGC